MTYLHRRPTLVAVAVFTSVLAIIVGASTLSAQTAACVLPASAPCSIWSLSSMPAVESVTDPNEVELGLRFTTDTNGHIDGLRFYKGPDNVGLHTGHLWTDGGALLASATFAGETATGWQQATFDAPVAISAGSTYVASYHTSSGFYSASIAEFANAAVDQPPLHAPAHSVAGPNGIYRYGPAGFPTDDFSATNYWVDVLFHESTPSDLDPPTLSALSSNLNADQTVDITWLTNEPADSLLTYGRAPTDFSQSATNNALTHTHTMRLTGLSPGTYYYRISSADSSANRTLEPAAWQPPLSFVVIDRSFVDTSVADFSSGTWSDAAVADSVGGEIVLAALTRAEFTGTLLPSGWSTESWDPAGSAIVAGDQVALDGSRIFTDAKYTTGRSFEFVATFHNTPNQHIGAGISFSEAPWLMFSTAVGDGLYARSRSDAGEISTLIAGNWLGARHRYRIDWTSSSITYWIDDLVVATHQLSIAGSLSLIASDYAVGDGLLAVDWARVTPYSPTGTFLSRVLDGSGVTSWETLSWHATVPAGTTLTMLVRTGETPIPDGTWSPFATVPASGDTLDISARYLQYEARLDTSVPSITPRLEDVTVVATPAVEGGDLTIDDEMVVEGDTGTTVVTFLVHLSSPSAQPVMARYTTADGTATAGSDYTPAAGIITFPPGILAVPIVISIHGDRTYEPSETFFVNLSAPVNTTIARAHATAVLENDDDEPAPVVPPWLGDTTFDEFSAGSSTGHLYVSRIADGELVLGPTLASEFDGSEISAGWSAAAWDVGDIAVVREGSLLVNGARVSTDTVFPSGRTLDFAATFGPDGYQNVGFGDTLSDPPWITFGVLPGIGIAARSHDGTTATDTALTDLALNVEHRFRIVWEISHIVFFVDDVLVATHESAISSNLRVIVSDYLAGGSSLQVSWLHMGPYQSSNTFTSRILDAGTSTAWGTASWTASLPSGTGLAVAVRTGDTASPDDSWTTFRTLSSSGAAVSRTSRFIQYQAAMTSSGLNTPLVSDVTFATGQLPQLPQLPQLSIADIAVTELPDHIRAATFTVSLSSPSAEAVSVQFATADGTAVAPADYMATAGTLTIDPGRRTATVSVLVVGDRLNEPIETFNVILRSPVNAMISKAVGIASIVNYDVPVDTVPPTIAAIVWPPFNHAGWNTTDVTVSFVCADADSGIQFCSPPTSAAGETSGQLYTGTALDMAGHQSTTSTLVKIDRGLPIVELVALTEGETTTNSSLILRGIVNDSLSGVASAACNGDPAVVLGGNVECVIPLRRGLNSIVLTATDAAGNTASAGVQLTRLAAATSLAITPTTVTLKVGESRSLRVIDDSGLAATGVTWTSSMPNVLLLSPEGDGFMQASAAGETTVTATLGDLSADAVVTVISSANGSGSALWTITPSADAYLNHLFEAHSPDDEAPDLFAVESGLEETRVRAFRADGHQMWAETSPGTPFFGDAFGGVIAGSALGLARFGGGHDERPWRYEVPGGAPGYLSGVAQAADGTVFFHEEQGSRAFGGDGGSVTSGTMVALDGHTGLVKFEVPLPLSSSLITVGSCVNPREGGMRGAHPEFGSPAYYTDSVSSTAVGQDGSAFVAVAEVHNEWRPLCFVESTHEDGALVYYDVFRTAPGRGVYLRRASLNAIRITTSGSYGVARLWESDSSVPDTTEHAYDQDVAWASQTIPDGRDGFLVSWSHYLYRRDSGLYEAEAHIARVRDGSVVSDRILPIPVDAAASYPGALLLVSDGTAYVQYVNSDWNTVLSAINVDDLSIEWTHQTSAAPVMAVDGGHVVLNDFEAMSLMELDAHGVTIAATALEASFSSMTPVVHGEGILDAISDSGYLTAVVSPVVRESALTFVVNSLGQQTSRGCDVPPFLTDTKAHVDIADQHKGLLPRVDPYTYQLLGMWSNQRRDGVTTAFQEWNAANLRSDLQVQFAPASDGSVADILVTRQSLGNDSNTNAPVAGAFPSPRIGTAHRLADGHIDGGVILLTTNENILFAGQGYLKASLHEIGHALGLAHTVPPGRHGSSVMNRFMFITGGNILENRDDRGSFGNLPTFVTPCDQDAAKRRATP